MNKENLSSFPKELCEQNNRKSLGSIKLEFSFQGIAIRLNWFNTLETKKIINETWHSHSGIEVHFLIDGSNEILAGNKHFDVSKNEMLIIPKNISHCLKNPTQGQYTRCAMNVDITKSDSKNQFLYDFFSLTEPRKLCINNNILNLLEECMNESKTTYSNYIEIIELNVLKILISIVRELTNYSHSTNENVVKITYSTQLAENALAIIEENACKNLSVKTVANMMHISTKHLQRIVQNEFHCTVYELIVNSKLQIAKHYLINTQMSIADISEALSFTSEQSFSRFFRKNEGQTATGFRMGSLNKDIIQPTP